ncbi:MAG: hypothetical protein L3K23_02995 [Thermoplasmata archaeon]|nr:hypothetical protein [Thermoplasmata archaeon]
MGARMSPAGEVALLGGAFPAPGLRTPNGAVGILLSGLPLPLASFPAATITNRQFRQFDLTTWDRYFLPPTLCPLSDVEPIEVRDAIEDDNRSAIFPAPVATMDGTPFYLSVKGVGSGVDPFSLRRLDGAYAAELTDDPDVRARLTSVKGDRPGGMITGELWLRGSPYGGQGLPHATTALNVSERADLTSLAGFRIAPVVKIALLPAEVEARIKGLHWYRKFGGRLVQELRLVPSNVRVYFHARTNVGQEVARVFDLFRIDSAEKAHRFEVNFVRSAIPLLTLFARTLSFERERGRYRGLDFQDVWLDKDAVVAPDGTIYFVDLEGVEEVAVEPTDVREKLEDQVYRSLYEFMFAYAQIEAERSRRYGAAGSRKRQFEAIVLEALRDDPFVRPIHEGGRLLLRIGNRSLEESLSLDFPLVDA